MINKLIKLGQSALPNNHRVTHAVSNEVHTIQDNPATSCLLPSEVPGLSTVLNDYLLHHTHDYRYFCNSWTELKELVESQTDELTYTLDFGWHIHPSMDYNSKDQLKNLIDEMKTWKNFQKLRWRFANGWDLYDLGEDKRIAWFKTQIGNVNPENVYLQFANAMTVELYKKHFPNMNIQVYLIYYTRMMETNLGQEFIANKSHREKYFICFNNYNKEHRVKIVNFIKDNKWEDKVDYSFLAQGKTLGSSVTKENTHQKHIGHWQDSPPHDCINRCYFYVVTETQYDAPHIGPCCGEPRQPDVLTDIPSFVSEKTLKAFQYEIPFIVVGLPHTLTSLKLMGYKTFPELFDESYDTELDGKKRMSLIEDAIHNLMNMSIEQLHNIVMQPVVQEKLLHNKRHFLKNYIECPSRQWDPIDPDNTDNNQAMTNLLAKW